MRLFLVLGLMISALSMQENLYGAAITSDQMCATLKHEYGEKYYVDNENPDKVKLKSKSGDRIVWWFVNPEKAFESDGLSLFKALYDNLGQGNAVYRLLVEGQGYKLHLSEETAALRASSTTPENHINLIKAWIATFKGQVISNALVVRSE